MTTKTYQAKKPVSLLSSGGAPNKIVATVDGTAVAMQSVTAGMLNAAAIAGRGVTKIVAAAGASAQMIAMSDYQCDGVADDVQINAALAALPAAGGTVLLSEGTFTLAAQVTLSGANRVLRGSGILSTVLSCMSGASGSLASTIVQLTANNTAVIDFTIDANKTNNTGLTSQIALYPVSGNNVRVERVYVVNAPNYGMVVHTLCQSAVVRDCVIEGSVSTGMIARGAFAQPTSIINCLIKSNGAGGINIDDGAVNLSDCAAITNVAHGFSAGGTAIVTFRNCLAQGNSTIGFIATAPRTIFSGCRVISAGTHGFQISGTAAEVVGCMVDVPGQHGFIITGSATDVLVSGCTTKDTLAGYAGFYHEAAGRGTYIGCRAINFLYWAFRLIAGEVQVKNCYAYGYAAQSTAMDISGGNNHHIDGCRIMNNGGYGIYCSGAVASLKLTNNRFSESSLLTNNGYMHLPVDSPKAFIAGNIFRDPASGNRPAWAIQSNGADGCLGLNDAFGSGVSGEVNEVQPSTLRKLTKVLGSFAMTTDAINGVGMTANVWLTIVSAQTFRVDSVRDIIEISVSGAMLVGNAAAISYYASQILIDGATAYVLGGEHGETTTSYQNPFTGSSPIKITGLSVGNHTYTLQIRSSSNAVAYLRGASQSESEFLNIHVVGHMR